jgi:hypothetical protein
MLAPPPRAPLVKAYRNGSGNSIRLTLTRLRLLSGLPLLQKSGCPFESCVVICVTVRRMKFT